MHAVTDLKTLGPVPLRSNPNPGELPGAGDDRAELAAVPGDLSEAVADLKTGGVVVGGPGLRSKDNEVPLLFLPLKIKFFGLDFARASTSDCAAKCGTEETGEIFF